MTGCEYGSRVEALEVLVRDLGARVKALERARVPVGSRDLTRTQRRIADAVSEALNVPVAELHSAGRGPAAVSKARMALYWHLHHRAGMSYSQIGRLLGRAPETVASGVARAGSEDMDDAMRLTFDAVSAVVDNSGPADAVGRAERPERPSRPAPPLAMV